MPLADPRAAADHIVRWFETLTPDSLTGLDDCYTPDATFKDPFNEVKGVDAIRDIFSHMYRALDEPRFIVTRPRKISDTEIIDFIERNLMGWGLTHDGYVFSYMGYHREEGKTLREAIIKHIRREERKES